MADLSLSQILWSNDPATRRALWTILGLVVPIAALVFVPLAAQALRLFFLERRLRDTADELEAKGPAAQRSALREWVRDTPLHPQFAEFERRWSTAQVVEGTARAPIRLLDVLEDRPLLAFGPRRSLLGVLPGLFLGIGVFGALLGLIPGVTAMGASSVAAEGAPAGGDPLALALGLALRAMVFGFAAAIAASAVGRLLEGSFDARSRGLDEVLARAWSAVSPGELAELTRQTQQRSLDTLGRELTQFAQELNERLERGLARIEQSSSRAASLVSQEQRGALHGVVQELSLSVRQGVELHLTELRSALQRAVDYQSTVTNGLSEAFERMLENAGVQERVARTLGESANALDAATQSFRSEARALERSLPGGGAASPPDPRVLEVLRENEAISAQIAEEIGQALRGFTEQVRHIDETLDGLRRNLEQERRAHRPDEARATADADPTRASKPPLATTHAATTADTAPPVAAPTRTERSFTPRERTWAPAPTDHPRPEPPRPALPAAPTPTHGPTPALPPAPAPVPATAASAASAATTTTMAAPAQPAAQAARASEPTDPAESAPGRGADVASIDGPIGRELSLSGFRVGTPRAQGPDPYERLAQSGEPPSNVRHFPTRDRELGDDLKLSGLLGHSPARSGAPATTRTAPRTPRDERTRESSDDPTANSTDEAGD